ncbi:MAG: FMN-dependent NADH-azoreductase [Afipia sp.]|nr:FMN-dependent NADH-azoreductase [Afipia sp.]
MKLLHIDASILGGNSVSRQLSAAAVERLRKTTPYLDVTYRDISATPFSHLSGEHLAAAHGATPETPAVRDDIAASAAALDEFLAADIVVIGAPMYNFTIPSQLKAWIDRILVAGKTFKYSEKGVEGLAGNKRVIVAISRGGFYGADTPAAAGEHLETYLRWVFGFIGITNPEIIAADGIQIGPEQREKAVASALHAANALQGATGQRAA